MAVIGVASVFSDFGLSLAAIRERHLTTAQRNNLFWLNGAVGCAAAAMVYACAYPIAAIYSDNSLMPVVQFLSLVFVMNGLGAQFRADLNRRLRFGRLAIGDVLSQLFGLGVGILTAILGYGAWALVWQQASAAAALLVIAIVTSGWRPGLPSKRGDVRAILAFGFHATLTQALNYISSNVDSIAIGRFWGPVVLGVYSRAFQLFSLPLQQLAAPITRVALPALAAAESGDDFQRRLVRAQIALCYPLVNVLGLTAGASGPIVALLLGPLWLDGAEYIRVLALGGVFQTLGYVYYWAFLAKAKMKTLMLCEAVGRGVMVVLILSLVSLGPMWVAYSYSIGLFVIWLVTSWRSSSALGISVFRHLLSAAIRPTSVAVVASLAAFATTKMVSLAGLSDIFGLVSGVLAYACVLANAWIIKPVRSDYRYMMAMARISIKGGRSVSSEVAPVGMVD